MANSSGKRAGRRSSRVRLKGIPPDFLAFLISHRPQLALEKPPDQTALAALVWTCVGGQRAHASHHGFQSHSHEFLYDLLGYARSTPLNHRTRLFMTTFPDRFNKLTAGMAVMPDIDQELYHRYRTAPEAPISLVDDTGRKMDTAPPVLRSRDAGGNNALTWRDVPIRQAVPVDVAAMEHLHAALLPAYLQPSELWNGYQFGKYDPVKVLSRLLRISHNTLASRREVVHEYQEASSGRLNALGVSLQTAPRSIRKAALNGTWDYDFANCHYSLLSQLARRIDVECPHVDYYLNHKAEVRATVMRVGGLEDIDDAKEALIALVYGASTSGARDSRLLELVGAHGLAQLRREPVFGGIAREIRVAGEMVIERWPNRRGGLLINDARKGLNPRGPDAWLGSNLAHLLQGAEAVMLKACCHAYADDILMPFHDGFVSRRRLDAAEIERLVYSDTGYVMRVDEDRIEYDWGAGVQTV